jgi:hypothetical protein
MDSRVFIKSKTQTCLFVVWGHEWSYLRQVELELGAKQEENDMFLLSELLGTEFKA